MLCVAACLPTATRWAVGTAEQAAGEMSMDNPSSTNNILRSNMNIPRRTLHRHVPHVSCRGNATRQWDCWSVDSACSHRRFNRDSLWNGSLRLLRGCLFLLTLCSFALLTTYRTNGVRNATGAPTSAGWLMVLLLCLLVHSVFTFSGSSGNSKRASGSY